MVFHARIFRLRLLACLFLLPVPLLGAEPTDPTNPKGPIDKVVHYRLPDVEGADGKKRTVVVTTAFIAPGVPVGTAEQTAAALNGGTAVPLNEVVVVNGTDGSSPTGLFALNAAGSEAVGADAAPTGTEIPQTVTAPAKRVPYLLAQLRVWKIGAINTGKNLISVPFQAVSLIRSAVAGGITYYGLVVTHHIPEELAMRATLLSAGAAYGASSALAFLKLWYNSLVPWEGLTQPKSRLHLTLAALYKGIGFITLYSYLSLLAVEVAKPGGLPHSSLDWVGLVGTATVYVLSQLFWGVKFLKDQQEFKTSDANLNLKMGVLAVLATGVLKYMAVSGPHYEVGYAAMIGTGAFALFWKPIKSWFKRRIWGAPDITTCPELLQDGTEEKPAF